MIGRKWGLGLALAVVVIGTIVFYRSASFTARSGEDNPIYSSTRFDPYGTAALQELLSRRGVDLRTLERPSLESNDHGVLIEVLPSETSRPGVIPPHLKVAELAEWMSRGNTVIQLTRNPTDLMQHFGIEQGNAADEKEVKKLTDFEEHGRPPDDAPGTVSTALFSLSGNANAPEDADSARLSVRLPMTFADKQKTGWKPIGWLETDEKPVVAGEFKVGAGKLVVIGSSTPALNQSLGEYGNLDFLLAEIGTGPVIFDEWSHGIGREATIMGFLRDAGLLPVLLQIVFVLILYVWSTSGVRRGAEAAAPRQRSSIEQIQTLGYLYSRSLSSGVTLDRVRAEAHRRLCAALRCDPAQIEKCAKSLQGNSQKTAIRLLQCLEELQSGIGPRCASCGYDLAMNQSGRCPECGTVIPAEVLHRLKEMGPRSAAPSSRRVNKALAAFAEALTLSDQLSREIQRDRRFAR